MIRTGLFNLYKVNQAITHHSLKDITSGLNGLCVVRLVGTSGKQAGTAVSAEEDFSPIEKETEAVQRKSKLPQKLPFVKNLFLGRFDKEVLTYPEVLDKERYDLLHDMVAPIERFFKEEVDSKRIDREAKIPPETLQGLKELGLYGLQIPEKYGGLDLSATEYARIAEVISLDGGIAVTLSAHQAIGLKGVLLFGTDAQKEKYLPRLATGEWTAAFCLTEASSGSDAASVQTMATETEDGKGFVLNGTKIFISNGGTADFMTVFAKTLHPNKIDTGISAFLVERNFGGVTSGPPEDKLGIRGSNTTSIHFDNTYVPRENLLGNLNEGFKVAVKILNSGRFSMGSACAGQLKELMKIAVDHSVNRKQFNQTLSEFALIKEKLAMMSLDVYAMESMAYLTAGLLDTYENQDCSVEAAIVKVFSSEKTWQHISECLQILGGLGYMKDMSMERYLRDARILQIFEGTNEILRVFIALNGLNYAGNELAGIVKKLRNPLMNPSFAVKMLWKTIARSRNNPKLDIGLHEFLHPSLFEMANDLERCTKIMEMTVRDLLGSEGREVILPSKQYNLKRLADAAIDMYAITAVLGRASRAYCIGVHRCEHEMLLAGRFTIDACERIKRNLNQVTGPYSEEDKVISSIAKDVIEYGGYVAQHPLTRTLW